MTEKKEGKKPVIKVLIVDDDFDDVELLSVGLKKEGYTVVTATDGEEAIQKAHVDRPDIIIMDILMPKLDGVEISMLLKGENLTKDIPVIFLTHLKKPHEPSSTSGNNIVLGKPVDFHSLNNIINTLVEKSRLHHST